MRQSISSRLQGKSRSQDEEKATKGIEDAKDGYTPPENVYEAILELQDHQRKDWARWRDKEYAIIPHTDAGGDAYFIGDFYEGIKCANEWEMEEYVLSTCWKLPTDCPLCCVGLARTFNMSRTSQRLCLILPISDTGWKSHALHPNGVT